MVPAIVVNAYNRPAALARLLQSLQRAIYPSDAPVPLIISIDRGGDPAVRTLAENFAWPHGSQEVIVQAEHLGLVKHFFACGELTRRYDAIVYLEDDLTVAPVYFAYATRALAFYQHDDRIAGLALYGLWFNGYTQQPFVPLPDGADAFFVQVPYTLGLMLTRAQWTNFTAWQRASQVAPLPLPPIHEAWSRFDQEDWFPPLARYVIATDRYFVYPRVSHVTGGDQVGVHFPRASRFLLTPVQRGKTRYDFKTLDEADAVYDSFFELQPDRLNRLADQLRGVDYTLDLYGTKSRANLRTKYVLTSRPCRCPIASFGQTAWPLEMNVIERTPGVAISLCRVVDVRWDRVAQLQLWRSQYEYFARGRLPRLTTILKLITARLLRGL